MSFEFPFCEHILLVNIMFAYIYGQHHLFICETGILYILRYGPKPLLDASIWKCLQETASWFFTGGKGIACSLFKLELNQWRIKSVKHRKLDLDVESSLCCWYVCKWPPSFEGNALQEADMVKRAEHQRSVVLDWHAIIHDFMSTSQIEGNVSASG